MTSKTGVSVSSSPVEFLWSIPSGFHSQILWGLLFLLPDSQAGKPDVGSRIFTPMGVTISSLWVTHLVGMGFDFVVIVSLLPSCTFFLVFGCKVSFL